METDSTPKACVGIVEPPVIYDKYPSQHMADLKTLGNKEELLCVFKLSDGEPKSFLCTVVRVDGAGNEVAFLWAEKLLNENHHFTCITFRHLGDSYLSLWRRAHERMPDSCPFQPVHPVYSWRTS